MVFVISSDGQSLDPCHEARARKLLKKRRAVVHRTYPFTIRLKDRTRAESVVHDHRLKLDPGSKTTGIAIVQEGTDRVVWAGELTSRGQQTGMRYSPAVLSDETGASAIRATERPGLTTGGERRAG